jgi:hypothetical protein
MSGEMLGRVINDQYKFIHELGRRSFPLSIMFVTPKQYILAPLSHSPRYLYNFDRFIEKAMTKLPADR